MQQIIDTIMTPSVVANKKILFIHIPKCAGVSMAETITAQTKLVQVGPHAKYRDIFEPGGKFVREEYVVFSFVRNPWDRLVSTFFYILKGGRGDIDKRRRDKYLLKYQGDFRSFVRDIDTWFFLQEEDSIYPDKYIPHFRPQYEFICDENEKIMVDFVGRIENISFDFNALCSYLSLQNNRLSKINKSSHRAYYKYYDDETIKIVAKYYAKDIELFDYQFNHGKGGAGNFFSGMNLWNWRKRKREEEKCNQK